MRAGILSAMNPIANTLAGVAITVASQVAPEATRIERVDPSTLCHHEDLMLSIWQSQNLVWSLDYNRRPALLVVDGRSWLKLPLQTQASVALAAFCRVDAAEAPAALEVRDQGERLFGTVSAGRWHNRLSGQ